MYSYVPPVSWCSSRVARGLTLIELLVTLAILSILAMAALPYAEVTVKRAKELELRRALREMRTAIDRFHEDWSSGAIPRQSEAASDDGYPKTLLVLVEGVDTGKAKKGLRRYLRRIPTDPFAADGVGEQWVLRSYQDEVDTVVWSGQDVYDIRSDSTVSALNGTQYHEW